MQIGVSEYILKKREAAWYLKKALRVSVIGTVILCQLQLFSGLYLCWCWRYTMRGKNVNSFLHLALDITWTCTGYFFTPLNTDVCLYLHPQQDMKRSQIPKGKGSWLNFRNILVENSALLPSHQSMLHFSLSCFSRLQMLSSEVVCIIWNTKKWFNSFCESSLCN